MTEQELQEAQDLIPRQPHNNVVDLHEKIQGLNDEINQVNEAIGFHHNQADAKKELKVTLEARREHFMNELRKKLGEKM